MEFWPCPCNWFIDLGRKSAESEMLTRRFAEEYNRYARATIEEPLSEPA